MFIIKANLILRLTAIFSIVGIGAVATAETITVPGDAPTIGDAIDQAQGDDIILETGVFGARFIARTFDLRSASVTRPCIFLSLSFIKIALESLFSIFWATVWMGVSIGQVVICGLNMAAIG